MEFKRSLVGYNPEVVQELLKRMDTDYKDKLKELKKQLADRAKEFESLKSEIEKLKSEIDSYKSFENKISQVFLHAHLKATEKVFAALSDAKQSEKKAVDQVQARKAELVRLKTSMEKIKGEIHAVAGQYRMELERVEGE